MLYHTWILGTRNEGYLIIMSYLPLRLPSQVSIGTACSCLQCLDIPYDYDFEYLGSANREVISPVTERVFVNLCMAVKDNLSTIISGPTVSNQ